MGYLWSQMPKDTTTQNYVRADYADGYLNKTFWLGLGRSETDWTYDSNPPDATVGTNAVEVLGYKKISYQTLCVPDPNGSLFWRSLRFKPVTSRNRLQKTNGVYPRWLYLRTTITTSELPTNKYFRQIFLYTDLVPKAAYTANEALLPSQVEDPGNLFYIENISKMYRLSNSIEEISFIFEF